MRSLSSLIGALLICACAGAPPTAATLAPVQDPLALSAVAVLISVRVDCPIANRYAPTVRALAEQHATRGARFDAALKTSPYYPEAWNNRGAALLGLQDLAGAIESFEQALEEDPEYPDAHFNLGMIKARGRDLVGARSRFERAIASDPEHVEATFNLGNVSLQSGDRARALALDRRTLLLAPGHASATTMLAKLEPKAK